MTLLGRTHRMAVTAVVASVAMAATAMAEDRQILDSVHFIIPGGAGGGWDGTARGTGEALTKAGLVGQATYENMSGGGGGVAIRYLIDNAESLDNAMMVNSTPIVIRSLTGVFPQSFRDLTLVAGTIGDYGALVVNKDSEIESLDDLLDAYRSDNRSVSIGGGSVPGGMDHLVAALVMDRAGEDPTGFNYIAYNAGGKAMAGLLSGEIAALSTGFSEAVEMAKADEVRILGVLSEERVEAYPSAPTVMEQGVDATFVNWRGFFAAPGLPDERLDKFQETLSRMYDTPEWEAVRARNGWVNIHNSGAEFRAFLEEQEQEIGELMRKLGFL